MTSISMTKKQVAEVLIFLSETYPRFEVTQSKIDTWYRLMKDQNPAVVMRNAEKYALTQKYPPSISELIERKTEARKKDILEEIKEWERDAVDKPRSGTEPYREHFNKS